MMSLTTDASLTRSSAPPTWALDDAGDDEELSSSSATSSASCFDRLAYTGSPAESEGSSALENFDDLIELATESPRGEIETRTYSLLGKINSLLKSEKCADTSQELQQIQHRLRRNLRKLRIEQQLHEEYVQPNSELSLGWYFDYRLEKCELDVMEALESEESRFSSLVHTTPIPDLTSHVSTNNQKTALLKLSEQLKEHYDSSELYTSRRHLRQLRDFRARALGLHAAIERAELRQQTAQGPAAVQVAGLDLMHLLRRAKFLIEKADSWVSEADSEDSLRLSDRPMSEFKRVEDAFDSLIEDRLISPTEADWIPQIIEEILFNKTNFSAEQLNLLNEAGAYPQSLAQYLQRRENRKLRIALLFKCSELLPDQAETISEERKRNKSAEKKVRNLVMSTILSHMHRVPRQLSYLDANENCVSVIQTTYKGKSFEAGEAVSLGDFSANAGYPCLSDKCDADRTAPFNVNLGTIVSKSESSDVEPQLLAIRSGKPKSKERMIEILTLEALEMFQLPSSSWRGLERVEPGEEDSNTPPLYRFTGTFCSHVNSSRRASSLAEENEWEILREICGALEGTAGTERLLRVPVEGHPEETRLIRLQLARPRLLHLRYNYLCGTPSGRSKSDRVNWQGTQLLLLDAFSAIAESLTKANINSDDKAVYHSAHDKLLGVWDALCSASRKLDQTEGWDPRTSNPWNLKKWSGFWDSPELKAYANAVQQMVQLIGIMAKRLPAPAENPIAHRIRVLSECLSKLTSGDLRNSCPGAWILLVEQMNRLTGHLTPSRGAPIAISCKSGDDRTLSHLGLLLAECEKEATRGYEQAPVISDSHLEPDDTFRDRYLAYVVRLGWEQSICSKGYALPLVRWGGNILSKNRVAREWLPKNLPSETESLLFDY